MRSVLFLSVSIGLFACATTASARAEPLYLAVQVTQDGKTVAAPKLLGFEGRSVTAERKVPGAAESDYRLVLRPREKDDGTGYAVWLDLDLPSGHSAGKVGLLHGEERRVLLDTRTELRLMLMRVDSPEFKALMDVRPRAGRDSI